MYEVEFSKTAKKQLDKLPKNIKPRIISALERSRIRPYPHVKKLVKYPFFVLRVGNYRVILDIKEHKLVIFVIKIGHRKRVYKDM